MPYLQMPYTDKTGTTHAQAVIVIRAVRVNYEPPNNQAEIAISIYHDLAAWNTGKAPVEVRQPSVMSPVEIQTYVDQFASTAYAVLHARREFQPAAVVMV
jgi:hypothetical protein